MLTPTRSQTQSNKIELYPSSSCILPPFWCPCMAINVSVQYNDGFLTDMILLTLCYYHRETRLNATKSFCPYILCSPRHYTVDLMLLPSGNPIKCHAEFFSLQPILEPMFPPKRFDSFSLSGGCSQGLDAYRFFFKPSVQTYRLVGFEWV